MVKVELLSRDSLGESRREIALVADEIRIGRSLPDALDSVALPYCGGRLSGHHCTLFRELGQWWLRDGNGKPSRNGTMYQGQRITTRVRLEPGQVFTLLDAPPQLVQLIVSALDDTVPPPDEIPWRAIPSEPPGLGYAPAQELQASRELGAIAANRPEFSEGLAWQLSERQARHDQAISELQRIDAQFQRELEERRKHFEALVDAHERRFEEALARHDEKLERTIADHDRQFRAALEKLIGEVGAVREDTRAANSRLKLLTRFCCGLAAAVSIVGAVTIAADEDSASKYSQLAFHLLTALITGGGLAAVGGDAFKSKEPPHEQQSDRPFPVEL